MDIHVLEALTPNRVMEQNLMESSFLRPGFLSQVLKVWDLTFGPDGVFGMDSIYKKLGHKIESWSKISWRAHFRGKDLSLWF